MDRNDSLTKEEIHEYIQNMAGGAQALSESQIDEIYSQIDINHDGSINKNEMVTFLQTMMGLHGDLNFKTASDFFSEQLQQQTE